MFHQAWTGVSLNMDRCFTGHGPVFHQTWIGSLDMDRCFTGHGPVFHQTWTNCQQTWTNVSPDMDSFLSGHEPYFGQTLTIYHRLWTIFSPDLLHFPPDVDHIFTLLEPLFQQTGVMVDTMIERRDTKEELPDIFTYHVTLTSSMTYHRWRHIATARRLASDEQIASFLLDW